MSKSEMKEQIFETVLQEAVKEHFQRELQELPTVQELTEEYELSSAAEKKIEKMMRDANRRLFREKMRKAAKRAAVIAVIVIPVSIITLLSAEASRNAIFNAVLEWKSDHVNIKYQDETELSAATSSSGYSDLTPQYLPEGFIQAETFQTSSSHVTKYQNGKGDTIYLEVALLSKSGVNALDTEHTTKEEMKVNGENAILFVANLPEEDSYLTWKNSTYSFWLHSKISSKELVKIAESIKK